MASTDIDSLYPPSPANVPPDLTRPSGDYRLRVFVVLVSLFAFLLLYLALTVGSAWFTYWCFATVSEPDAPRPAAAPAPVGRGPASRRAAPAPRSDRPDFAYVLGGIASALLCLFMVKGFFKRSRRGDGLRVELREADEPELFAFIRKLCADTKAPFPHRIYCTPEVNAAVAYHESIVNLFWPARKNLIIGLGLLNRLNLAEFKAVLAHEFGHFSQNSMKLGTYVYTSNRIIADLVYGRDWFDDLLGTLSRIDLRISIFVWAFAAVVWVVRTILKGVFRAINFAQSSLSRQMEYNADLVAVSVTGSDSLIFALARMDFAAESLGQAWTDLTAAADHKRYSRDLYFHQTKAAEYLRQKRGDPSLGVPPPLPADERESVAVFRPEDTSVPAMWATHPANFDREANAKARYIRSPMDDRPAWALFRRGAEVRADITRQMYELNRKEKIGELEDPEAVQAFIDAEHAETSYHPRYHGLYDDRYVKPGELAEIREPHHWGVYENRERLAAAHDSLYESIPDRMAAHKTRLEELRKLGPIAHGGMALRGRDFEHRGARHSLADAKALFAAVEKELDADYSWMHELDREVFRVHYAMAAQLGPEEQRLLEDRYRFHLELQGLYTQLRAHNNHVNDILASISGQRQLNQDAYQGTLAAFRQAHITLDEQLAVADEMKMPPLTNIEPGAPLGKLLLSRKLIRNLKPEEQSLSGEWINKFLAQMGEVLDRAQRMLFKSLGGLLAHEEALAERWRAAGDWV